MNNYSNATLEMLPNKVAFQRRIVLTLSSAQLLSGIGNGAGLAIGSLMAVELTGSNAFAGAATFAISVAGAISALPLAGLAVRRGRRIALSTGILLAACGAVLMMFAPVAQSFALLLLGAALLGVGNAANLQARFAATDLAADATRGRDLGLVVWAITIGAVAGPNLIGPGSRLGSLIGLPPMSGPFIFSVIGMLLAVLVLNIGLRPDPIAVSKRFAELADADADAAASTVSVVSNVSTVSNGAAASGAAPTVLKPAGAPRPRGSLVTGLHAVRESPGAALGIATIAVSHLVMVGIMSMTPVHLKDLAATPGHAMHADSGDILVIVGFVISLHIAGMYALSPFIGSLADRFGKIKMMLGAQVVLALAVLVAGLGADSRAAVTVGLVLLGIGWSMGTVSGSAYLSERVAREKRVQVQGVSDTLMSSAGAIGAAGSGPLLAVLGYAGLGYAALVLVLLIAVACLRTLLAERRAG